MKSPEHTYTNPQEHLSGEQLRRYQSGQMDGTEMHRIEQHLLNCELCSDALEGMAMLDAERTGAAMGDLKSQLKNRLEAEKPSSAKTYWPWVMAASVLLLFTVSLFLFLPREPMGEREALQTEDSAPQAAPPASTEEEKGMQQDSPDQPPLAYTDDFTEEELLADEFRTGGSRTGESQADQSLANRPESAGSDKPQPPPRPQQPEINTLPELAEVADEEEMGDVVTEEIVFEEAPMEVTPDFDQIAGHSPAAENPPVGAPAGKADSGQISHQLAESSRTSFMQKETTDAGAGYRIISGKVTDPAGEPLPGVSIRLKGTREGTNSNFDGEYSLRVPASDTAIELAFVGFVSKSIPVAKSDSHIQAVLEEDVKSLSEVVVTGRSTRSQSASTSAHTTAEEITPPRPVVGPRRFKKYLREQQQYPAAAKAAGVEGSVGLVFYVEKDGSLSDIRVTEPLGHGLDGEAIRLLQQGPAWKPATTGKESIRHKVEIEIPFTLE